MKIKARVRFQLLVIAVFAALCSLWAGAGTTRAATGINKQINFQGKLVNANGTNVANGNYNMEFKLYDAASGGTTLWTETRLNNNSQGVPVTDGVFQVNLGSITPLPGSVDFNTDNIYLGINVGSTNGTCTPFSNCSPDGEMTPRIRFTAAPYAFNADALDGLSAGNFVQLAQGVQTDASTTNPSIYINKTGGTADIVKLERSGTAEFVIDTNGNVTIGGNITFVEDQDAIIKIADQTTANTAGNSVIILGGSGNGSGNGGNVLISGGVKGTSGVPGSVIIKPQTNNDSNAAFQLQNAAGVTNFLYDSVNSAFAIGNNATINTSVAVVINQNYNGGIPCLFGCFGMSASATATGLSGNANLLSGAIFGVKTENTAFTVDQVRSISISNPNRGTASTITNNYGVFVDIQTAGTNNYGVYIAGADTYSLWVDSGISQFDGQVQIGASDTTGVLLVLDQKTDNSDPTGTNGAMYYNSGLGRFRCYENDTWVNCNGNGETNFRRIHIKDEFISGTGEETGEVGELGWNVTLTGAATDTTSNASDKADHIGTYRCLSSTTNPSGCLLNLGLTETRIWGGEVIGAVIKTPSSLTATNIFVGLGDAASGTANSTDAVQLRKVSTTSTWEGEVRNNGVSNTCDTGVTASAGNYVQVKIVVNSAANSTSFFLNGATTANCSISGGLPTSSGRELGPIFQFRNNDTTSGKTGEIDLFWFERYVGNRWT